MAPQHGSDTRIPAFPRNLVVAMSVSCPQGPLKRYDMLEPSVDLEIGAVGSDKEVPAR